MKIALTAPASLLLDSNATSKLLYDRTYEALIMEVVKDPLEDVMFFCYLLYDSDGQKYTSFAEYVPWTSKEGKLIKILRAITNLKLTSDNFSSDLDTALLIGKCLQIKFRANDRGFSQSFFYMHLPKKSEYDRSLYIRPSWVTGKINNTGLLDVSKEAKISDILKEEPTINPLPISSPPKTLTDSTDLGEINDLIGRINANETGKTGQ